MHGNLLDNVPDEMTENTFRCWTAPKQRVECALPVLDQISSAAWDGFRRFRHGGMEVGGILLGSNTGDTVRVREALPFDISYKRGAVFLLTDADYESLDRLMQKADREVARKGLRVVGYYESHTRRGAELSEDDLQTYEARFDQPSRVCIVVKPNNENGTIINVYIRDHRGDIVRTELEGDAVRYEETAVPEPPIAPIIAAART